MADIRSPAPLTGPAWHWSKPLLHVLPLLPHQQPFHQFLSNAEPLTACRLLRDSMRCLLQRCAAMRTCRWVVTSYLAVLSLISYDMCSTTTQYI